MKNISYASLFILLISLSAHKSLAEPAALRAGLEVLEYPRHVEQSDQKSVYLATDQFGRSIGKRRVIESLSPWEWNSERNAVARGLLIIEKDGDYAFTTDSFYDRNLLMISGEVVCEFSDGGSKVVTVPLKKGMVEIVSVGYVESRGSALVRWRPPGQRELSAIPSGKLKHVESGSVTSTSSKLRDCVTIVAKDFVTEVYKNGVRIPDRDRKLLLDRFGATAERVSVSVRPGDWLVFHLANNRLRHKGSKYFGVAGHSKNGTLIFVTDPASEDWSVCDEPARVREFIRYRDEGTESRAVVIARPWEEGDKFMRKYADRDWSGQPLWGTSSSTWIKFIVPEKADSKRK